VRWRDVWRISERVGADGLPIIALIAFLLGLILAFQSAVPMKRFGAEIFVADLIGLAMVRELGPLMTAILLAGRTGAAFAAEIGTMTVNQEVDALTTMGLSPVRFLVTPRIIAAVLMTPLLTLFSDLVGMIGGALTILSGANLTLQVGDSGAGRISAGGTVTLTGGTLTVNFKPGFVPSVGDTLSVVKGASLRGKFSAISVTGFKVTPTYTSSEVLLHIDG